MTSYHLHVVNHGVPQHVLPVHVVVRITDARTRGLTLAAIAHDLNAHQVPTGQGGTRWYPSSVRAVLSSQAAEECYAAAC